MDTGQSQRLLENVFFFSLQDINSNKSELFIDSPTDACYLHFLVPFEGTHYLPVKISVVPFCLTEFPGQTFYYAQGSYTRCCPSIDPHALLPAVVEASQKIYTLYIRHHRWDFESSSSWEQRDISPDVECNDGSCLFRSTIHLNKVLKSVVSAPSAGPLPIRHDLANALGSRSGQGQPARGISSKQVLNPQRRRGSSLASARAASSTPESPSAQDSVEKSIVQIADDLLACLAGFDKTAEDIRSYLLPLESCPSSEAGPERCASAAWKLCMTGARQAREQFKHAYFTRYTSLCFFLLWETFSCKVGKACAREINVKMKEAGFEGTSRTLKSLRDETIFINQLIASAERLFGSEPASRLLYCIFESSNYRFIRSINRYSRSKKLSVVKYICSKMQHIPSEAQQSPSSQIQDILRQYLPGLSLEEINAGIRYRPFDAGSPAPSNRIPSTVCSDDPSLENGRRDSGGSSSGGYDITCYDMDNANRASAVSDAGPDEMDHDGFGKSSHAVQVEGSSRPAIGDPMRFWDGIGSQWNIPSEENEQTMWTSPLSRMPSDLDCWFTSFE